MTAPGFGWIISFTVACEIGDTGRFVSPVKLTGYTGLCPRVKQSGDTDKPRPALKARAALPALSSLGCSHRMERCPE
jgi:hypothetical protein